MDAQQHRLPRTTPNPQDRYVDPPTKDDVSPCSVRACQKRPYHQKRCGRCATRSKCSLSQLRDVAIPRRDCPTHRGRSQFQRRMPFRCNRAFLQFRRNAHDCTGSGRISNIDCLERRRTRKIDTSTRQRRTMSHRSVRVVRNVRRSGADDMCDAFEVLSSQLHDAAIRRDCPAS